MVGVGLLNMLLAEWGVVLAAPPRPVMPATGFDGVTVLNEGLDLKP